MNLLPISILDSRLLEFLQEDLGFGDITTEALIPPDVEGKGTILTRSSGILAGALFAKRLFELVNVPVTLSLQDGILLSPNDVILTCHGKAHRILQAERVVLNLLARLSGIATATHQVISVAQTTNPAVRIAATRKTTPGFRYFEKYAIQIAQGDPHRFGLSDAVLIKDNHLAIIKSIPEALKLAKTKVSFGKIIEIEVESMNDAILAAKNGAHAILLDNMTPEEVEEVVRALTSANLRDKVILEASGGITLQNVAAYAKHVDVVSLGALTHSVTALDFSLDLEYLFL
jgi:nicotinate-nucleotide pyrophosphorylase (carboxylating)